MYECNESSLLLLRITNKYLECFGGCSRHKKPGKSILTANQSITFLPIAISVGDKSIHDNETANKIGFGLVPNSQHSFQVTAGFIIGFQPAAKTKPQPVSHGNYGEAFQLAFDSSLSESTTTREYWQSNMT